MILTKVKNEIGATAIEYGLIASLVAVVAVSGMSAVGGNLSNTYCTISKHLGGSGTCSGSVSSGTGGNGSSTGSGNSTTGDEGNNSTIPTSVTTEEDMDNLKNSLQDDFDNSFLDKSLGGTDGYNQDNIVLSPKNYLSAMNNYNTNHPNDQITHVFGLYDSSTKQPITSFAKASQGLNLAAGDDYNAVLMGEYKGGTIFQSLEVTTQQGNVYTVDGSEMTKHLVKGS